MTIKKERRKGGMKEGCKEGRNRRWKAKREDFMKSHCFTQETMKEQVRGPLPRAQGASSQNLSLFSVTEGFKIRKTPSRNQTWGPLEQQWQLLLSNSGGGVCAVSMFKQTEGDISQSVQSLSRVQLCNPMDCSTPGLLVHHQLPSLLRLMSIESVMPSNHLSLFHPLLLLPSIFPSIRVFSNESALRIRWPKYWSFSFSISPSNEYSGLISFRINWLDLLYISKY